MDHKKIGKFIAEQRKIKKLTQSELAEQLGVTDRAISNWENGKNMPDYSLLTPLSKKLNITVNELLSGEKLNKEEYQNKFEENVVNLIDYNKEQLYKKNRIKGISLLVGGFLIVILSMLIFPNLNVWDSTYSVLGIIVSLIGFSMIIKKINYPKKLILIFSFFILYLVILFILEYTIIL